jgi:hypothetical protein
MRLLPKLLALAFLFSLQFSAFASHYSGAALSYRCIGTSTDSIEVSLRLTFDCSANVLIRDSVPINIVGCISNFTSTLYQDSSSFMFDWGTVQANQDASYESSQICASQLSTTRCAVGGNALPGSQEVLFKGIVVLPNQCPTWTIYHDVICCRNTSRNIPSGAITAAITLDNQNFPCNNSPEFGSRPMPMFLAGPNTFNPGVREVDGDSLVFSFDCGYSGYPAANSFQAPYTCSAPLSSASIDSRTGQVDFNESVTGNYFVIIKVEEYDRLSGMMKSSVLQDFMLAMQIDPNNDQPEGNLISNLGSATTQLSARELEVTSGNQLKFDYSFVDADTIDSVSVITNIHRVLPGAQVSLSYPIASRFDSLVASVSWTATNIPGNWATFYMAGNDNKCPILGLNYQDFVVRVIPSKVSIAENFGYQDVQVFPNPSNGELHVVSEQALGQMTIFDLQGRKLLQVESLESSHKFQLESLSTGTYILELRNQSGLSTHRFFKK